MSKKAKTFVFLHIILLVYSFCGVLSKKSAQADFLSADFFLLYGGMLMIMAFYALVWQQIIKRIPLSTAFANKSIVTVWSVIWGRLIFKEEITVGKVVGLLIILAGIILLATEKEDQHG